MVWPPSGGSAAIVRAGSGRSAGPGSFVVLPGRAGAVRRPDVRSVGAAVLGSAATAGAVVMGALSPVALSPAVLSSAVLSSVLPPA
ncbi:hypothetical protein, partial [Streptomyces sp. NPDC048845]|uniref:hypothetical protein n=1 Tax=Streptomyces sp. NPDC048845 TaxID=3155390 RepID=UPI00342D1508